MATINEAAVLRFYLDTQEYSDRLTAIEAQAASNLTTQHTEVAAAIAQINLTQSQTITALTLEVSNLRTDLTNSITATQTDLINRADQLAQDVTDITVQLTQDKAIFNQEIQNALVYLQNEASVASALRTPRKIQGVDFDGTQDISLPTFSTQIDGLVPKRIGATADNYLREDGTWVVPTDTTYALLTKTSAEVGTATAANTISAQVLKDAIKFHAPPVTDIVGNAGTATKLQTPRAINGVSFDGTSDITIAAETPSIATITSDADLASATTRGLYSVAGYSIAGLHRYGLLRVWSYGGVWNQMFISHNSNSNGSVAIRQSWNGSEGYNAWRVIDSPNVGGNAATATKLQTACLINGIAFDGTGDINLDVYSKAETDSLVGTPDATETVAGKAKIATSAIAQTGVNDTDIITALKLRQTLEASKSVLAGSVNFNGTGTVRIRSQLNVSSITDLGIGKYRINMTTAMPNINYPVFTSVANRSNGALGIGIEVKDQTINSITVSTFVTGANTITDVDFISVGWTL